MAILREKSLKITRTIREQNLCNIVLSRADKQSLKEIMAIFLIFIKQTIKKYLRTQFVYYNVILTTKVKFK